MSPLTMLKVDPNCGEIVADFIVIRCDMHILVHRSVISSLFVPPTLVIPSAPVGYKGGGLGSGARRSVRTAAYVAK